MITIVEITPGISDHEVTLFNINNTIQAYTQQDGSFCVFISYIIS